MLTEFEKLFLRSLKKIRVVIREYSGHGEYANTANFMQFMRDIGFNGWFEVIYFGHDKSKAKVEDVLGLKIGLNNGDYHPSEKIVFYKESYFYEHPEKFEELTLGITGGALTKVADANNRMLNAMLKVKVYLEVDSYLLGDSRAYIAGKKLDFPTADLFTSVREISFSEAMQSMQQLQGNKLSNWNFLMELIKQKEIITQSIYGLNYEEAHKKGVKFPRELTLLKLILAMTYVQQRKNFEGKPIVLFVHQKQSAQELENIARIVGGEWPVNLEKPKYFQKIMDAVAAYDLSNKVGVYSIEDTVLSASLEKHKIVVVSTGSLPKGFFEFLQVNSTLPPVQEGRNTGLLFLKHGKPFLHAPFFEEADEFIDYVVGRLSNQTRQNFKDVARALLPVENLQAEMWNNELAIRHVGEFILQALEPNSTLVRDFLGFEQTFADPQKNKYLETFKRTANFLGYNFRWAKDEDRKAIRDAMLGEGSSWVSIFNRVVLDNLLSPKQTREICERLNSGDRTLAVADTVAVTCDEGDAFDLAVLSGNFEFAAQLLQRAELLYGKEAVVGGVRIDRIPPQWHFLQPLPNFWGPWGQQLVAKDIARNGRWGYQFFSRNLARTIFTHYQQLINDPSLKKSYGEMKKLFPFAIALGDLVLTKRMLESHPNLARQTLGWSSLMVAIAANDQAMIKLLQKYGAVLGEQEYMQIARYGNKELIAQHGFGNLSVSQLVDAAITGDNHLTFSYVVEHYGDNLSISFEQMAPAIGDQYFSLANKIIPYVNMTPADATEALKYLSVEDYLHFFNSLEGPKFKLMQKLLDLGANPNRAASLDSRVMGLLASYGANLDEIARKYKLDLDKREIACYQADLNNGCSDAPGVAHVVDLSNHGVDDGCLTVDASSVSQQDGCSVSILPNTRAIIGGVGNHDIRAEAEQGSFVYLLRSLGRNLVEVNGRGNVVVLGSGRDAVVVHPGSITTINFFDPSQDVICVDSNWLRPLTPVDAFCEDTSQGAVLDSGDSRTTVVDVFCDELTTGSVVVNDSDAVERTRAAVHKEPSLATEFSLSFVFGAITSGVPGLLTKYLHSRGVAEEKIAAVEKLVSTSMTLGIGLASSSWQLATALVVVQLIMECSVEVKRAPQVRAYTSLATTVASSAARVASQGVTSVVASTLGGVVGGLTSFFAVPRVARALGWERPVQEPAATEPRPS